MSSTPFWEFIQANTRTNPVEEEWSYDELSSNPNITWELVRANPDDKEWNYEFLSNPHLYFQSARYRRKMTAQMHATIYNELIMRACTPARMYQWNESAAEEFPEEYARECLRYKAL
jgi:hypothetical protein